MATILDNMPIYMIFQIITNVLLLKFTLTQALNKSLLQNDTQLNRHYTKIGRHFEIQDGGRQGAFLAWHWPSEILIITNLAMYQVSCFYHKMHDFFHISAPLFVIFGRLTVEKPLHEKICLSWFEADWLFYSQKQGWMHMLVFALLFERHAIPCTPYVPCADPGFFVRGGGGSGSICHSDKKNLTTFFSPQLISLKSNG